MDYNLKKLVVSMWEHRNNKDFERKSLESSYRGLSVKASIGMTGNIAKIPWISYCADGQETQKGIYPVLLFYGTPEFLERNKNHTTIKKIVLAYGVSATKTPDILWGAEVEDKKTIGESFVDWKYETSDNGIKKYNSSYVYKTYDWTDNIDFDNIQKDVDQIIDIYKKIISGPNLNSMKNNDIMKKGSGQLTDNNKSTINFLKINPSQIIYYGAPGTGKSYTIRKKEKAGLCCIRTTFHPDCDYATFVGCYKPHLNQKLNKLTYEFVEQSFLAAYIKAWQNPLQEIALVIEEINRGNCAQIFGDLFQLLDRKNGFSEYPIEADEDIQKAILEEKPEDGLSFGKEGLNLTAEQIMYINKQYDIDGQPSQKVAEKISQGQVLVLPPNFYIWATMNTSDQSLFPIDSAFKRRWEWKYVRICEGKKKDGTILDYRIKFNVPGEEPVDEKWWNFVKAINKQIEDATKSEDKKLGFFFCKPDKKANDTDECNTVISAETFVGKVVFYLWQDVFKDYGFKSNIFKRENGKKISFHDFYPEDMVADKDTNPEGIDLVLVKAFIKKVLDSNKEQPQTAAEA